MRLGSYLVNQDPHPRAPIYISSLIRIAVRRPWIQVQVSHPLLCTVICPFLFCRYSHVYHCFVSVHTRLAYCSFYYLLLIPVFMPMRISQLSFHAHNPETTVFLIHFWQCLYCLPTLLAKDISRNSHSSIGIGSQWIHQSRLTRPLIKKVVRSRKGRSPQYPPICSLMQLQNLLSKLIDYHCVVYELR